ncbi:unnamed protein product [Tenebrio molitor]|nr:unnamed protein product [Tenebrio molitor]
MLILTIKVQPIINRKTPLGTRMDHPLYVLTLTYSSIVKTLWPWIVKLKVA